MSNTSFWKRTEELMQKTGCTKKELAAFANINISNFSKGLKNGNSPSADTATKIAEYLNTTVEYLVTGHNLSENESSFKNDSVKTDNASETYAEIFRLNLKHYRELRGWTQSELAIQTDISYIQISNFESGKTTPSFEKIIALSQALNIHPALLFSERVNL